MHAIDAREPHRAIAFDSGLARAGIIAVWITVLFFFLSPALASSSLGAKEFRNKRYGYFVDVPESWAVLEGTDSTQVSFAGQSSQAVLQIIAFPQDRFQSPGEIAKYVRGQFNADGEVVSFSYQGRTAALADFTFSTRSYEARGYFLFLNAGSSTYSADFLVMSTAPVSRYRDFHDQLLSALNSFAPGPRSRHAPGPVSQFYYPFPPPGTKELVAELPVGPDAGSEQSGSPGQGSLGNGSPGNGSPGKGSPGKGSTDGRDTAEDQDTADGRGRTEVTYRLDPNEAEVSQIFIEREARILAAYAQSAQPRWGGAAPGWKAAWKRYYRVIYRDNYLRLESLAKSLEDHVRRNEISRDEIPRIVLRWLQGFRYRRVSSVSDLSSPVTAVIEQTGDCDSLGLVYTILLDHMGFDTILLVSNRYSHALAGVVTEGDGARYRFEGRSYLLAELTQDVELGLIPQEMANPAGWIPISF